ncbi:uncharacterized protein IL334_003393 [Kwoniella shivajii]|uniref:Deacetylase sirtuin-type domain-containing protein n=1 Tax=Kwoniella shivajii TaxID=564305 RepID=A0ABZ1CYL8_9TREE|nr:hypothetical protein IL334_003393 [Kwoniella shivajii]
MPITHLPLDHLLSSTSPEDFSSRRQLSDISTCIAKAKKVVVVSGAGISCSSGIPDFRSADGLYSLVKSRYPDTFFTGKDLFSSGLFSNPSTTSIFYTFIAELAISCSKAEPTKTHHFIKKLEQKGKLLRSYTQNVDGLERRLGLESGGRGKGFKKKTTRNVELHGDLGRVRCVLCFKDFQVDMEHTELFRQGLAPDCPACEERCQSRISRSARATPIGTLRPSIVLYDEPHPLGDDIGSLTTYDLSRQPDLLLIMGTSLKVHGLKRLVKEFAKSVHTGSKKRGLVIFVNATPPPAKEWEGIIDFHIQGETDKWVEKVEDEWKKIKPTDWQTQTRLDDDMVIVAKDYRPRIIKGKGKAKAKPLTSSDKVNRSLPDQMPVHLPTPRTTASPRSPAKHHQHQQPSSPVANGKTYTTFDSDSELSDAPPTPPTPFSPSKRRSNAFDSPSKKTKSFDKEIPITGLSSTPGKGNLFSTSTSASKSALVSTAVAKLNAAKKEDVEGDWTDEWEIFHEPKSGLHLESPNKYTTASYKVLEEQKENIPHPMKKETATRSRKIKAVPVGSPRVRRTRVRTVKT